ncbi:MAG: LysM peptidoglycan-binding domain-containing M23 family metallopeptidase, partial [Rhodospirillales bacterium]|nr:LysM peptidoglycan-binding domain-containing M23 family metallopeptidase [Rhodospirillales bacterium]
MIWRLVISGFLVAVVAGGCGWAEWPPPSSVRNAGAVPDTLPIGPAPRPQSRSASGSDLVFIGADSVTVGPGDTVYSLSQRHQVSQRALIEVNSLKPPYQLAIGRRLVLPRERIHPVTRGDTLYSISRRYDVDMYELAQANQLGPPFAIRVGQQLRIPAVPQAARPDPATAGSNLQVEELAPPPSAGEGPPVTMRTPSGSGTASPPASSLVPGVRPDPATPDPPPPTAGGAFIWPARGQVILEFGPKAKGLHNDGINIEAPRGAPVYASAGGVVAYAGNELRGFGNLLLVKHPDGWVTAYAHNDRLLVKRGDTVKQGQLIARVGSTGNVTKPQ